MDLHERMFTGNQEFTTKNEEMIDPDSLFKMANDQVEGLKSLLKSELDINIEGTKAELTGDKHINFRFDISGNPFKSRALGAKIYKSWAIEVTSWDTSTRDQSLRDSKIIFKVFAWAKFHDVPVSAGFVGISITFDIMTKKWEYLGRK